MDRRVQIIETGADTRIADDELFEGDGGENAFQDDFTHFLEQNEEAAFGPDGQPLDDMDHKFNLREMQKAEDNEEAPFRSVGPTTWDRGVLGGIYQVQPAVVTTNAGPLIEAVFWPGEDKESRAVTVTIQPEQPLEVSPVSGSVIIRPTARINWGTRNGKFQADVDVGTGFEFTLSASYIYVSLGLDGGSNTAYNLLAGLSFYSASHTRPALRTTYLDSQGSGAGGLVNIARPAFANTIEAFDRSDFTAGYTLDFKDINGVKIGQRIIAASTTLAVPLMLANDVRSIDVTNSGAGGTSSRLVFGLF